MTNPGCTCDPSLPPRKRCTSRTLRCAGAMAAHVPPADPPDVEEERARGLAYVLAEMTMLRPNGPGLTYEMIQHIAAASEFLDNHAFRLKRARLMAVQADLDAEKDHDR